MTTEKTSSPRRSGADWFGLVAFAVLVICSAVLVVRLISTKFLPTGQLLLAVGALLVLSGLHGWVQLPRREKTGGKIACGIVALVLAAAMLCAEGESSIEDVVFERRFGCAEGFERLGGRVNRSGRVLSVGPLPESGLHGATLTAPDLRGGAALVVAALSAQGKSFVEETRHIDRGYAGFTEILAGLGAQIRRESATGNGTVKKTSAKKQICLAIGAKR